MSNDPKAIALIWTGAAPTRPLFESEKALKTSNSYDSSLEALRHVHLATMTFLEPLVKTQATELGEEAATSMGTTGFGAGDQDPSSDEEKEPSRKVSKKE